MKKRIKKIISNEFSQVSSSRNLFILGIASVILILSTASGYFFLENQELENQLNIATSQKKILDAEVPDPVLKFAPMLVSSNDSAIKELAKSMGSPDEIYRFVRDEIKYSEDYDEKRIAIEVLNSKQGDCLGKSDLLAGLLLAYGYSSKEVIVSMGYVTRNDVRRHHAWVELYSNGKWIVLDSSQFLGNFEFDRWDKESFYLAYQAQPYVEFNNRFVQVIMDSNG